MREYYVDIIERDVRRHVAARSSIALSQIAKTVFESTGSETSLRNLAKAFEISIDTVKAYLEAFESAYLCIPCPYFTYSERKSVVRSKKYYPIDLGMRAAIVTRTGLDLGKKFETVVFHALRRKFGRVSYWRGKGEVDFVVEASKGVQPIQVSWDGAKDRHRQASDEFAREHPGSLPALYIDQSNCDEWIGD